MPWSGENCSEVKLDLDLDLDPDPGPGPDLGLDYHYLHLLACLIVLLGNLYITAQIVFVRRPEKPDYPAPLRRPRCHQCVLDVLVDLVSFGLHSAPLSL